MRPPVLLKRWLPVAGLATLLSGCVPSRQSMPVMLFVAVAVQDESNLTSDNAALFRERFQELIKDFRRIHPNVMVQPALYPEGQLRQQLQIRDRAGLGPDLILTGAESANTLLRAGLVDPMPNTPQLRDASSPELRQRLTNRRGQLRSEEHTSELQSH